MAELNGITYTEYINKTGLGETPDEAFGFPEPSDCHSRTTKVLTDVPWTQRQAMTQSLLGQCYRGYIGSYFYISRTIPYSHLDWTIPGTSVGLTAATVKYYPYLWANKVQIKGFGVDTTQPAGLYRMKSSQDTTVYNKARMTVELLAFPFLVLSDAQMIAGGYVDSNGNPDESTFARYVTILPKPSGRFIGLGAGASTGFTYANYASDSLGAVGIAGSAVPVSPGMIQQQSDVTITHWRVTQNCVASIAINPLLQAASTEGAIDTAIGKVNSTTFLNYPMGTVLYLGCEYARYIDPYGVPSYDIHHHFQYKRQNHLCEPAFDGGKLRFVEISTTGTSYKPPNPAGTVDPGNVHIYDSTELRALFRCPI